MYEALLKNTPEYQKTAASLASPGPAARFGLPLGRAEEPSACRCGQVITGYCPPRECPLFGTVCLPENPVGPCMVSGEGACAAAYQYQEV